MLCDDEGTVTDRYTYDAFGNITEKIGLTENSYLYYGEQYDSFTGLYYLRARYMSPTTGTFITMDEYAGSVFEPVSLHKYLYANANPVMYCDPSGYNRMPLSVAECGLVIGAMGILAAAGVMATQSAMGTGASIAHEIYFVFTPATEMIFNINEWELDFGASAISKWGTDTITIFSDPLPHVIVDPIPEHNFSNVLSFPTAVPQDYIIFAPAPIPQQMGIESFPVPIAQQIGIETFPVSTKRGIGIVMAKMTNQEATKAANKLGYEVVKGQFSHGQQIYYNHKTKTYISQDIGSNGESHNGGTWKMAKTPQGLISKQTRMGTYDKYLNRIGD